MKRIVVGVDGSPGSRAALVWAADEARVRGATLVVVHVWQPPAVYGTGFAPVPVVPPDGAYEEAANQLLDTEVAEAAGPIDDLTVERHIVEGAAGDVLVSMSDDVDLVVVGAQGHGNLVSLLLGSVSQHCAHRSRCPVVIVPRPSD
jgi:nucleotide-binding universal stress UspA family protein